MTSPLQLQVPNSQSEELQSLFRVVFNQLLSLNQERDKFVLTLQKFEELALEIHSEFTQWVSHNTHSLTSSSFDSKNILKDLYLMLEHIKSEESRLSQQTSETVSTAHSKFETAIEIAMTTQEQSAQKLCNDHLESLSSLIQTVEDNSQRDATRINELSDRCERLIESISNGGEQDIASESEMGSEFDAVHASQHDECPDSALDLVQNLPSPTLNIKDLAVSSTSAEDFEDQTNLHGNFNSENVEQPPHISNQASDSHLFQREWSVDSHSDVYSPLSQHVDQPDYKSRIFEWEEELRNKEAHLLEMERSLKVRHKLMNSSSKEHAHRISEKELIVNHDYARDQQIFDLKHQIASLQIEKTNSNYTLPILRNIVYVYCTKNPRTKLSD
ncbi:hypothetical protein GEMRC1_003735 [Eukaryota sp. GEM-RC1]